MKTSSLLVTLFLAFSVSALPQRGGGRFGGFGNRQGGKQGQQGQQGQQAGAKGGAKGGGAATSAATGAAATGAAGGAATGGANNAGNGAAAGNGNNNGNNGNAAASGDPQTSTTLDPKVIAEGFAQNGQAGGAEAGQVPSLTSTNNFINFCLTRPDLPLTNGQQIQTGSCNPAPIGLIPSIDNMPSSKFSNPVNGATVPANQAFTVSMKIKNIVTGNFVNAQKNYFAAPQQLQNGQIVGHSHIVIEQLTALDQPDPTDPKKFVFFKGINGPAQNGAVTADVTKGVPAGAYRMCSINASANHQPVIVPVAQHGSLDDCIYFTATAGGAAGGQGQGANNGNAGGATGGAAGGQQGGQQSGANGGQQGGANGGQQQGGANGGQQGGANGGQQGGANGGQRGAGRGGRRQ